MVDGYKKRSVDISQISTVFDPPMFYQSYLYFLESGKIFHLYCLLPSSRKERKGTISVGVHGLKRKICSFIAQFLFCK